MNCTDWTDNTEVDGQYIRKISGIRTEQTTRKTTEQHGGGWTVYPKDQWNPYRTKTNYTENHGKARRQVSRDSVTLRENPCSNEIIRKIRSIRAEFSKSIN